MPGNTLTVSSIGGWVGSPSFNDQWLRCASDGSACVPIAGAVLSSQVVSANDLGSTIRFAITASNAGGSTTATSLASAVVATPGPPTLSTFMRTESDAGDSVGGGQTAVETSGITASSAASQSRLTVSVTGTSGTWSMTFDGAGQALTVGAYQSIAKYPGNGSQYGMAIVHGGSSPCSSDTGYFAIRQLAFGSGTSVASLDIVFEQHCNNTLAGLHGEVAINATGESSSALVPDLGMDESANDGVGGTLVYTARVFSNGPVDSAPVTFSQPLPAGTQFVSAAASQGSCDATITCNLGSVAGGDLVYVTVVVSPASTGIVSSHSTITASADYDASNDAASSNTQVFAPPSAVAAAFAFQSYRTGKPDIFTMSDSAAGQAILSPSPYATYAPAWSPDGKKLVFDRVVNGNDDIYVANDDGTGLTRLTTDPATDENPSWAGSKIVFDSTRGGGDHIWVMDADGSNQTKLPSGYFDYDPALSPDGSKIAFVNVAGDGFQHIWVMDVNGFNSKQLTTTASMDTSPAWSPDGTKIAFSSDWNGNPDIWVMNADGSNRAGPDPVTCRPRRVPHLVARRNLDCI